jgi:hypothetical protein
MLARRRGAKSVQRILAAAPHRKRLADAIFSAPLSMGGNMRTFGIIMAVLLGLVVLGAGVYWFGHGAIFGESAISAEVVGQTDLEITSHSEFPIIIRTVYFNDRHCASQSFGYRFWYVARTPWGNNLRAGRSEYVNPRLNEGDTVTASLGKQNCGNRIVKAEVATDRGSFLFVYPDPERRYAGDSNRVPLLLRWHDRP